MFLWLAPWPIRKSIRFSNSFSRWLLLCYCYDFAPKNFMFQWIDEVSATPPYQLMADGDQATRIAAERVWPNIKLLMCYIHVRWKPFFSAPNYYLCIFVQESCSKKICSYWCLWHPSLRESNEGSPSTSSLCCGPRGFLSSVWTFPGNKYFSSHFTFSHQISTM